MYVPQILHEMAYRACDFFVFVCGERNDGLKVVSEY